MKFQLQKPLSNTRHRRLRWTALLLLLWTGPALARLTIPELPEVQGVDPEQGPIAALESIVTYFVYLIAALSIIWVVLSVGRRVIGEFNDARKETGDFGRVVITAFVGVATTLFVVFLANYLGDIIS